MVGNDHPVHSGVDRYVVITVIVILLMAGMVTAARNRVARQRQEEFVRSNALAGSPQRADPSLGSVDDCARQRSA
jgi:ABC-type dipeptide/oligopeptide/nickel transport system permease subunit